MSFPYTTYPMNYYSSYVYPSSYFPYVDPSGYCSYVDTSRPYLPPFGYYVKSKFGSRTFPQPLSNAKKSFTIDSILGLSEPKSEEVTSYSSCVVDTSSYFPYVDPSSYSSYVDTSRPYLPPFGYYVKSEFGSRTFPQPVSDAKKSFTIDSILGLSEPKSEEVTSEDGDRINRKEIGRTTVDTINKAWNKLRYPTEPLSPIAQAERNSYDNGNKPGKSRKRIRTLFSQEQLNALENEFEKQQYMVGQYRRRLARKLQLSDAQVKVWFQNRRIKWRKEHPGRQPPAGDCAEELKRWSDAEKEKKKKKV